MKKIIKTVFVLIAYIIITTGYIAYYSLKGLFVCPIIGKIGILFSYAVMGISYHYNKKIFWGILVVIGVFITYIAVYCWKSESPDDKFEEEDFNYKENVAEEYFYSLNKEEAKAKYRKLIKMYHPDNIEFGDVEKSVEITTAYSQYMARFEQ